METPKIRNLVCGVLATSAVLSYVYIGDSNLYNLLENHDINIQENFLPKGYDINEYYTLISKEDKVKEQIGIIHDFISNLIENSEDLDPNFAETVTKHFWDLA